MSTEPLVSVVMPTYNQSAFISRAIASMLKQQYRNWELIIVNDGSDDNLQEVISPYRKDHRLKYISSRLNKGLGAAINVALDIVEGEYIAYLPADDIYFDDHLSVLLSCFTNNNTVLAYAHVRHHYNKIAEGYYGNYLQLVQVMHRKTDQRWITRDVLESDDLHRLFWHKLEGEHVNSGSLTCEWTDHPMQRHKIMQEPEGGINLFRNYYKVKQPLRFHSTKGHLMDEVSRYQEFRQKDYPLNEHGLKILIVGELAYNAERILALREQGHQLFGLWMREPYWYNSVGPLPFGHVTDIDPKNYVEEVSRINPDIIYGCLNWQAVPFVHEVINNIPGIPFCWHFKEGPFICIEKGTWKELVELYMKADGRIYCSEEMKMWFDGFLPPSNHPDLVLDGDLPKADWFNKERSDLLSDSGNGFHTVVPGRPIGLHPEDVAMLASQDIHLHFYGEFTHGQWKQWIERTLVLAPDHLHIHPNVDQENWVREFSRYDAGWLHYFQSSNRGYLERANWDDLNIPARMATLALSGLPMIQKDNTGHIVATRALAEKLGMGIFINQLSDLCEVLRNREAMKTLRDHVWNNRKTFTFDAHTTTLLDYFQGVIRNRRMQTYTVPKGKLHR